MRCSVSAIASRYSCRATCCAPLGTTEIRQPPPVRERPALAPRIPPPLPQQEGLEAVLGLRAHNDGVFARPHEIAHRFIRVVRHVEAMRDLVRAREDAVVVGTQAKYRLKAFLL